MVNVWRLAPAYGTGAAGLAPVIGFAIGGRLFSTAATHSVPTLSFRADENHSSQRLLVLRETLIR